MKFMLDYYFIHLVDYTCVRQFKITGEAVMKTNGAQDQDFRHPGTAEVEHNMERSKQLRSEVLGKGISRFVGYIRSFDAKDRQVRETRRSQEAALTALL